MKYYDRVRCNNIKFYEIEKIEVSQINSYILVLLSIHNAK